MSALVVPEQYFGPTRGVMGRIAVSLSGQWFLAAALTVLIVVDYPKVWAEAGPGLDGAEVGDAVVTGADLGPNLASVVSLAMALTSERRLRLDSPRARLRLLTVHAQAVVRWCGRRNAGQCHGEASHPQQ